MIHQASSMFLGCTTCIRWLITISRNMAGLMFSDLSPDGCRSVFTQWHPARSRLLAVPVFCRCLQVLSPKLAHRPFFFWGVTYPGSKKNWRNWLKDTISASRSRRKEEGERSQIHWSCAPYQTPTNWRMWVTFLLLGSGRLYVAHHSRITNREQCSSAKDIIPENA